MTSARNEAQPRIETLEDRCTPAAVTSVFPNGADGWTTIRADFKTAGAVSRAWVNNGGNPGGYVRATDVQDNNTWYWRAPNKFRGDHDDLYGTWLTYDLRQTKLGGQFNNAELALTGGGLTLQLNYPTHPGTAWTPYAVKLTEAGGWRLKSNNQPPTEAQFKQALGNVKELLIRGEFTRNKGVGSLDNVRMGVGAPWLMIGSAARYEGPSLAFAVSLSHITATAVSVDFATADGSAQDGSDYGGVSGTLVFNPGQRAKTITVNVFADSDVEANEGFTVTLSNAVNADLASAVGVGTIINDD
jgi:hypothetical protein